MATLTSKGTELTLSIIKKVNGVASFVNLPQRYQEILNNKVKHDEYMLNLTRVWENPYVSDDGTVKIILTPKFDDSFDVTTQIDSTTGKVTGGILGAENSGRFGYIEPTTLVIGETSIAQGHKKAIKTIVAKEDIAAKGGIKNVLQWVIKNYFDKFKQNEIALIKNNLVETLGTVGKAASEQQFSTTVARVLSKDYPTTEAGGISAIIDINAALNAKSRIGLEDGTGVEVTYPFARGMEVKENTTLIISEELNVALLLAVRGSYVGYMPATKEANGQISGLFGVTVIVRDMPEKAGKKFNWMLVEKGENGAVAVGTRVPLSWRIRDNSSGIEGLHTIIESPDAHNTYISAIQPELNFGSFGA